jgi:WD40 repeat protein
LSTPHTWYLKARLTAWASQNLLAVGFPVPSLLPGGTVIASECAALGLAAMCANPPLALPDRAFEAVYQQARAGNKITIPPNPEFHDYPAVSVAWRPDGKALATLLPPDGFYSGKSSLQVTLYDTATGKVIETLSAPRLANVNDNDDSITPTYWSPAGTQLAFVDTGSTRVTIWGASSLPA